MQHNKINKQSAPTLTCETVLSLGKGGITLIYGDYHSRLHDLAKSMACHSALIANEDILLEVVGMESREARTFLAKRPANLEVFVAETSDGAALVHAATKVALCKNDLSVFSTLAPSLNEDWFESSDDCMAWQVLRDEAYVLDKTVGIFLFTTGYGEIPTPHQMSYANTVYRTIYEDGVWTLECIKSHKKELRSESILVEAPAGLVNIEEEEY